MILSFLEKLCALWRIVLTLKKENKLHLVLCFLRGSSLKATYRYNFKVLLNSTHIWQAKLLNLDRISIYISGNETLTWHRLVINSFRYKQDLRNTLNLRQIWRLAKAKSKWTNIHAYQTIAISLCSMLTILLHFNRSINI